MTTADPQNSATRLNRQKQEVAQLAQAGHFVEARTLARKLCKKIPQDPEIWFLLGAIHGELSDFPEAEKCCRHALTSAPQHPVLNFNLAIALTRQGKPADAIPFLKTAIQSQPGYAEAYHELANTLYMNEQYQQAIDNYRKALELAPGTSIFHHNMAHALHDMEHLEEAIEHYEKALTLNPDSVETCSELASAFLTSYRFSHAVEVLESAIKRLPDVVDLHFKLAVALQEQGDSDKALAHYRKTLALDATHADARTGIAGILGLQGNYTEAGGELISLIKAHPKNVSAVIIYAHFAQRLGDLDRAIKLTRETLESDGLSDLVRSKLEFSLGELLEQNGDPHLAFQHYESGNRLRKAIFNYDNYKNIFDAIKAAYPTPATAALPHSEDTLVTPIFIVGMPRSGTSLVEQILASHQKIFGAGELPDINDMVDNLPQILGTRVPYPACIRELNKSSITHLAKMYLDSVLRKSGTAEFVTDKMPSNFMHLGFIRLLFPGAKIIHCMRDPLDTCLSCYFKHFSGAHPYAYDLADLGRYYRLYQDLMRYWRNTLQPPMYEIGYETLVSTQESETRKLLDFCGLDWSEDCLNFHKSDRTVSTASHSQVRQPIHTKSMGRWRLHEQHLGPLISALEAED